jgi:hypothetical protein
MRNHSISPWPIAMMLLLVGSGLALAQWAPDGVPACAAAGDQFLAGQVSDRVGGLILTWFDERLGVQNDDVYAQRISGDGLIVQGWPVDGAPVCAAAHSQIVGGIVEDGASGAIMAWDDGRRSQDRDIYAGRMLDNGQPDPEWPAGGKQLNVDDVTVKSGVVMAPDGAGGAYVVWNDYSDRTTGGDIYAQHILNNGTLDSTWPTGGIAVCNAPGQQLVRAAPADGVGGFFVIWEDFRTPEEAKGIYAQHMTSAGSSMAAWPTTGLPVSVGTELRDHPTAVLDGQGGIMVAWRDYRSDTDGDLYALRITNEATPAAGWTLNGMVVANGPGPQWDPSIVGDGQGGFYIAYWGRRTAGGTDQEPDISVAHLDSGGQSPSGWPAAGLPLCAAAGRQDSPRAVSDGSGGVVVAWTDWRSGSPDVYAARLLNDATLATGWPENGIALTQTHSATGGPMLVPDGIGGALVAWTDNRSGNTDIYLQRVTGAGVVAPGYVPPTPPPLLRAFPNPAERSATVAIELTSPEVVWGRVFDLTGRLMRTLGGGRPREVGVVTLFWDLKDEQGHRVPSGVYLMTLTAGAEEHAVRVTVVARK